MSAQTRRDFNAENLCIGYGRKCTTNGCHQAVAASTLPAGPGRPPSVGGLARGGGPLAGELGTSRTAGDWLVPPQGVFIGSQSRARTAPRATTAAQPMKVAIHATSAT